MQKQPDRTTTDRQAEGDDAGGAVPAAMLEELPPLWRTAVERRRATAAT